MKIYCIKEKKQTDTKNEKKITTANGRHAIQGICSSCGTKKTKFIAGKQSGGMFNGTTQKTELPEQRTKFKLQPIKRQLGGESWLNKLLTSNKLPEMHYFSPFSFKKHNFTGPFTKLDKRLDKNKKPLPNSKPINRVDQSALNHDLAYDMMQDQPSRKIADNVMIDDLDMIRKDKNAKFSERGDALLVSGFMRLKRMLGLGKNKKRKVHKKRA